MSIQTNAENALRSVESENAEITRLRDQVRMLRSALALFCQRRDRGEIRSSTTYKQFKQLLELTKPT